MKWRPIGTLRSLYRRDPHASTPLQSASLQALAHQGLVGDKHASARSPRQVLLADEGSYARFALEAGVLRENLRVDIAMSDLQSGDLLRVGDDVVLWLTFPCEPCGRLERHRPGLSRSIGRERGMLARVLRGGTLSAGDAIWRIPAALPPMSDHWQARVKHVVQAIPLGHDIDYRQLAELAGVATAYCRAFPKLIAGLPAAQAGQVVKTGARTDRQRWEGHELFDVSDRIPDLAAWPTGQGA